VSQPHPYPQPYGYRQPTCYPHPVAAAPAYPQPPQVPARWAAHPAPWSTYPTRYAAGDQRLFVVRVTKHTGLVMGWLSQRYTVTGTFAHCEAAIRQAQRYNLLAGWWSVASLLVWNWVALLENTSARTALRRQAAATGPAYGPGSRGQCGRPG
jgi:hypothetical protein